MINLLNPLNNTKKTITLVVVFLVLSFNAAIAQHKKQKIVNIVFTSDAHYGLTRPDFDGDTNVNAKVVNAAMISKINTLPRYVLPKDGGVGESEKVNAVDYLIQTGDIANRMEIPIQSATESWKQFNFDYVQNLTLKDHQQHPAKLLMAPGNHDISNAIGYSKKMSPKTDPAVMVGIYNAMLNPSTPKTSDTYNYETDKINYAVNIHGIHVVFITLWPDSAERIWMENNLKEVPKTTPVIIFCHDQPTCEAKHFTNPISPYNMTKENKFENLVAEHYKEGAKAQKDDGATDLEQAGWVEFLKAHPNIKAYFHGNSNYNEFYVYKGPKGDVALNTFRVDSPMKGKYSSKDEKLLSFQLISLNPANQKITVRECLWNTDPSGKNKTGIVFGKSKTVSLKVN